VVAALAGGLIQTQTAYAREVKARYRLLDVVTPLCVNVQSNST
jgi:hypothetical protein